MELIEHQALNEAIDAALGIDKPKRGRKPDSAAFNLYRGYASILKDLTIERDRIKVNIAEYGIGAFGHYAKANKAQLVNAAQIVIGYGCSKSETK